LGTEAWPKLAVVDLRSDLVSDSSRFSMSSTTKAQEEPQSGPQALGAHLPEIDRTEIVERECRQNALREQTELHENILESLSDGIAIFDTEFRFLRWNRAMEKLTGVPRGDLIGSDRLPWEVFPHLRQQGMDELMRAAMKGEIVERESIPFRLPDGKEGFTSDTYLPVRAEDGQIRGIACVVRDVTQRERTAEALRESERRFRTIFDQAAVGVAQIETRTGRFVRINRKYCDIVGIEAADMTATTFMAITHPHDLQLDLDNMEKLKAGNIRHFSMEKRYIRPDGSIVWVNLAVSAMWEIDREPEHHIAVVEDITDRKRTEEALRQSEERFRRAFASAAHGMALVAPAGRWLRVNRALCNILEYSEEELLKTNFQDIIHREDLERHLDDLRRLRAGGVSMYQAEGRCIHKQGRLVWTLLSMSPVRDENRNTVHFVVQIQDITERKRAERLAELAAKADAGLLIDEVLDHVFETFRTVIPFERIGCAFLEDGGRTVRSVYGRSLASEIELPVGYSAPLNGTSLESVLEAKRPRILNNLEAYLREHPDSDSTRRMVTEGIRSSLTCPLVAMGKPVGFLFFSSTKLCAYSDSDVETYLGIAERLSLILEKGRLYQELTETKHQLELRNELIQDLFGRYTSEEVASRILESPQQLQMGGETRKVTILLSDLRGFTEVCVQLEPQAVVRLLNIHLGAMADVIINHHGTIDEFLGDSILALFGAPVLAEDDARRALACALDMQRAMGGVNAQLAAEGLPTLELGIGIHTGDVVVGNIGSHKRTKYGVVGPPVNLASRIQACTLGGQILCSEDTLRELGDLVEFDGPIEVRAKGFSKPIVTFPVRGLRDEPDLSIPAPVEALVPLTEALPVRFRVVEEKRIGDVVFRGELSELSQAGAQIRSVVQVGCPLQPAESANPCPLLRLSRLSDLMLFMGPGDAGGCEEPIYAKVTEVIGDHDLRVRFTSLSPATQRLVDRLLAGDPARPPLS
jgi:PAS domain S-box-containing protein